MYIIDSDEGFEKEELRAPPMSEEEEREYVLWVESLMDEELKLRAKQKENGA